MTRLVLIVLLACLAWAPLGVARADVLADFDTASMSYREQRFSAAASAFEAVIATAANNPADQAIVLEARKYLAACYLFLERPEDANRQFELLLELDPSYRVDPATFPSEFIDRFENVRRRVEAARLAELETQLENERLRVEDQRLELELDAARYRQLYDFAAQSLIVRRNSRLVAMLPFGIGQFQNRNARRGRWFAITEAAAIVGYVSGYVWRRLIEDQVPTPERRSAWERQMTGSLALNWSSGISFLVLAVSGAVEAEVNFVPTIESTQQRSVPERFRPAAPAVEAHVHVSPFGAGLELTF